MGPKRQDTRAPWLRRGLVASALVLGGAGALFVFSKPDLDAIARTGINAEIGRIAGAHADLRDDSAVTVRPDLRVVVADPIVELGDDQGALSVARIDATLRPTPLLQGQAEIASLHLHRPHLTFDSLDVAALFGHWADDAEATAAPAHIEIVDGVLDVADAMYLSDLNLSIAQPGVSEGVMVQGDFVVGSRRAIIGLQLDDPHRAFSEVGSAGSLSIRFDPADEPVPADQGSADPETGLLADVRQVVENISAFGRRPLTIDGHFAMTSEAIRISDATVSHSGIALTGDLHVRAAGADLPVLAQLLAVERGLDAAVSDLMHAVDVGNWADAPIRTNWINGLEADFTLAGQDLSVGGTDIDTVSVSLIAKAAGASLDVLIDSETLGRFSAQMGVTQTGEVDVAAALSDASMTSLSQPIAERMQARLIGTPQLPEGALDADLRLDGRGATLGALFGSLSGAVTASMQDGSLSGGDVTATLQTLANGRQFMTKEKGPLIPAAGRTYFDLIDGHVGIEAGTARISRLTIAGDRLEIDMLGEVGLKDGAVSVVGNAQLSPAQEPEAEDIARHVDLPFGIGGTVFTPMVAAGVPQFEMAAHVPSHHMAP
ncbi:AsmA-like C-terminal region-containing protein [Tateyamaria sp. syn59]|uniref:AsmA-like C-terminal region-containing protein n=1 Tax=Tateyamaria sp. syn59 TaxID=2576942 RepID=UPI0016726F21|nr:AsmA-like C-terminal region-containing protein [Tateyamaria sp. syn59]